MLSVSKRDFKQSFFNFTSFTVLPIIGHAVQRHRAHLKSGSRRKRHLMPLHFLCFQHKHLSQKIARRPTPVWQTPQGASQDSFSRSKFMSDTIIFVYPTITHRPSSPSVISMFTTLPVFPPWSSVLIIVICVH